MAVFVEQFKGFSQSVPRILRKAKLAEKIKSQSRIILKPNLTTTCLPPCTTPVELVEELIKFCQVNSRAEITIAEGSGGCDTKEAFDRLGYTTLAKKYQVKLVDLNRAARITLTNPRALVLKNVKLPKIIFSSFFINLPVLKEHDAAIVTCASKNLFGLYLNQGKHALENWWNKSELHLFGVWQSIVDLNSYVKSDFVLVDASVGQKGNEISGRPCQPAIGKLIAGLDTFEVDRFCAPLLGHSPEKVPYLVGNRGRF